MSTHGHALGSRTEAAAPRGDQETAKVKRERRLTGVWAFLTLVVMAAAAVACFAVYTWGWHQKTGGGDRALTYARTISFTQKWELIEVKKDAPFWVARYTDSEGAQTCVAIDVKQFASAGSDVPLGFRGTYQIRCRPVTP